MRRRIWLVGGGALTLAVGFAFWLPGYRLERELAIAHEEGLWTEAMDVRRAIETVPPEANAAPLLRDALTLTLKRHVGTTQKSLGRLLKGTASDADKRLVRTYCEANADLAILLRRASDRSRLD